MRIRNPFASDVGKSAVAVVPVKVNAGEIAHNQQVEIAVAVQIRERSTIRAAPAFLLQTGGRSRISEIAMSVIKQEVGRIAVVGVVKGVGRGSVGVRFFV